LNYLKSGGAWFFLAGIRKPSALMGAPLRNGAIGWTSPPAFGSSMPVRWLRFPASREDQIYHIVVLGTKDRPRSDEKEYPVKTWSAFMAKPSAHARRRPDRGAWN